VDRHILDDDGTMVSGFIGSSVALFVVNYATQSRSFKS
jgi:hypothetical protein